jgi:DNA-binding HxlR family transcriptional regulator
MVMRKSLKADVCPIARALNEVGDHWTLLIVREASEGICRFNDFQRKIGLAKNILSSRLKSLVEHAIIGVHTSSERKGYQLTRKGRELQVVLLALRQWSVANLYSEGESITMLVDKLNGKPLRRLELRADDGRLLEAEDIEIHRSRKAPLARPLPRRNLAGSRKYEAIPRAVKRG